MDEYWDNVVLLVHWDGDDASTTFYDASDSAHALTAAGNAQLSTAVKKFGTASLKSPEGTSPKSYVSAADSADWDFGTGDFTIECFVQFYHPGSDFDTAIIVGNAYTSNPGNTGWELTHDFGSSPVGILNFSWDGSVIISFADAGIYDGAMHHIAVSRTGTTLRLLVDGAVGASNTHGDDISGISNDLWIANSELLFSSGALVYVDELRITKGVGRYTGSYTVPTAPFPEGAEPYGEALGLGATFYPGQQFLEYFTSSIGLRAALPRRGTSAATIYFADLIAADGTTVRASISSWQSTLRAGSVSYAQCVIPAVAAYVDAIADAEQFAIIAVALDIDGSWASETELFRAPVQTVQFDRGTRRYTGTVSGYWDGWPLVENPEYESDIELPDVQSVSISKNSTRVRCALDLTIIPSMRIVVDGKPIVVDYINQYVSMDGLQSYMDVGGGGVVLRETLNFAIGAGYALAALTTYNMPHDASTAAGDAVDPVTTYNLAHEDALGAGDSMYGVVE